MFSKINDLEQRILYHQNLYYNEQPEISDKEFDELVEELRNLNPTSPILKVVGAKPTGRQWPKAQHKAFMGSLNKASNLDELMTFLERFDEDETMIVTEKYDGISICLNYVDGELKEAITRGDGQVGELITKNVLKIPAVHEQLPGLMTGSFKGEIVLPLSNFEKINKMPEYENKFSNARNAASGIVRESSGRLCHFLRIIYYDIESKWMGAEQKMETIKPYNHGDFNYYMFTAGDRRSFIALYDAYKSHIRAGRDYMIDGLVIKADNPVLFNEMGLSGNRPKAAIALKFPPSIVVSEIIDIIWSTTRSGRVNPKAQIEPVNIDGATVQFASLHNWDYIKKLNLGMHDKVEVKRSGDIIPQISRVVGHIGIKFGKPTNCPNCHIQLLEDGKYLVCKNSKCDSISLGKLNHFVNILELDSVGSGLIKKFYKLGWDTPDSLYKISFDNVKHVDGIGEKTFNKFKDELYKKSKMPLWKFFVSLGIDGLGKTNAEKLANEFMDGYPAIPGEEWIECLYSMINDGSLEMDLSDFGIFTEATMYKIIRGFERNRELINKLGTYIVIVREVKREDAKSFCITGKLERPRNDYVKILKSQGHIWKSGVSKDLDYLVTNDTDSGSSKNRKAKEYNIQVISEEEFKKMLEI